jgi:hypothetical protein
MPRPGRIGIPINMSVNQNWVRLGKQRTGELREARVATKTREGYRRVVDKFLAWVQRERWDMPRSVSELDGIAEAYVEDVYRSGLPHTWVYHLPAALAVADPRVKGQLPCTSAALMGLRRLCPGNSWAPMPIDVVMGVAGVLYHRGESEAAMAILLSFDCYLRIGEVVKLSPGDLVLPGDAVLGAYSSVGSINLRETKTGKDQSVVLTSPLLCALLARHRRGLTKRSGQLFPTLSESRLRRLLRVGLAALGIPRASYVFHSLRHGGAAFDFHHGYLPFAEIQQRGRWISPKTCRIYLQRGRSRLVDGTLPSVPAAMFHVLRRLPCHRLFELASPVPSLRGRSVLSSL